MSWGGQAIATNSNLLGQEQNVLYSPSNGIVLGMTTLPFVSPGDPVCHIGVVGRGLEAYRKALESAPPNGLFQRIRDDLASRLTVTPPGNNASGS